MADSYKGAVAQLGERLVCNQEATGSIPVSSTKVPGRFLNEARQEVVTNRGSSDTYCHADSILAFHLLACQFVAGSR